MGIYDLLPLPKRFVQLNRTLFAKNDFGLTANYFDSTNITLGLHVESYFGFTESYFDLTEI